MSQLGHEPSLSRETQDLYIENSVQVEFDTEEGASFIGLAPHPTIKVVYRGMDVFSRPAEEVFAFIQKHEGMDPAAYDPEGYLFTEQIITVWNADEQYDINGERFPVWGQVGIGNTAYAAAMQKYR